MENNNKKEVTIYLALLNNNLDLIYTFSDCSLYILSCLLTLSEEVPGTVKDPILNILICTILEAYLTYMLTVLKPLQVGQ